MRTPDRRQVDPQEEILDGGSTLFRVHSHRFGPTVFNPGTKSITASSRFAFFGRPPVPVLYAAETPEAAISETILHDVPADGGRVDRQLVENKILSHIINTRPLRLLSLHGHGFRRIGIAAEEVTRTVPRDYPKSVRWAEAAFEAGFDGITWMSRHHDTSKAYVFFQRIETSSDFEVHQDQGEVKAFAFPQDLNWLTRLLAPLNVTISDPS